MTNRTLINISFTYSPNDARQPAIQHVTLLLK